MRRSRAMAVRAGLAVATACLALAWLPRFAAAFPANGNESVLPPGSELNEEALDRPREIFRSEAQGGVRSYLVNLGDLAFNSPAIFGGVARRAGISCGTCHVNGAGNARLFIPGLSTRPGNFDTSGGLFNPKADNGVRDPVRIPSLRGARLLAPYGNDGRFPSLREFVRNAIVNEFAGPEPSPAVLDAIVAYVLDIDFLPNHAIDAAGRLTASATAAERHGEALFKKPFPHDPELSCAGCHVPSSSFVDHAQHNVGSGGAFKTPTLLNADFNAPYFHDGRYDSYVQVVDHFDRVFNLGLSAQDKSDLVAYLTAVGDGVRPYERDAVAAQLKELTSFASVIDVAITSHDVDTVALAVDTVGRELREIAERFPDRRNSSVTGGSAERGHARNALKELVVTLRRIGVAASAGQFDEAASEYLNYRKLAFAAVPLALTTAEPWSLFNPAIHDAHFAALRQLLQSASQSPH